MMTERLNDRDKRLHFLVCVCASLFSIPLAVGLALGKEYGDKNASGNHWCWLDLLADFIGIAVVLLFTLITPFRPLLDAVWSQIIRL